MPLQMANSELSEKSGMLQAEKKILEDEIKRWKARTQVCDISILQFCLVAEKILIFLKCFIVEFGDTAERFRPRGVQTFEL